MSIWQCFFIENVGANLCVCPEQNDNNISGELWDVSGEHTGSPLLNFSMPEFWTTLEDNNYCYLLLCMIKL